MKKIISICLATVLMLLSFQGVFADGAVTEKQSNAISLLNGLRIFQDVSEESGSSTLTRAEFAKIIARLMGGESGVSGKRIFTDVLPDHEAAASIEFLYNTGVMNGYGGAEFRPDGTITLEEAVKVAVEVIGYSNRAQYEGGWSTGYYSMAASAGLLRGVPGTNADPLTYASAAILIQNILENDKFLVVQGYKDGEPLEKHLKGQKYMEHMLGIYKYTGVVESLRYTSLSGGDTDYGTEKCEIGGEVFQVGDVDLEDYIGMKVNVYYHMDERDNSTLLYVSADSNVRVIDVEAEDIASDTGKTKFSYYDNSGKLKTLTISSDAIYLYNGKRLNVVTDGDLIPEEGSVRLINNGSGYNVVLIKEYETFVADKVVGTEYSILLKYDEGTLDFGKDSNVLARYFLDGEETEFTSISSGSILTIAKSKNPDGDVLADVYISNNQVAGTAKSVSDSRGTRKVVLDDGSEFYLTKNYEKRLNDGQKNTYLPEPGQEGTFYIDYFSRLAAYGLSAGGKNYAYVTKYAYNDFEEKGKIRLFNKDGKFETLDVIDKVKINGVSKAGNAELLKSVLEANSPDTTGPEPEQRKVTQLVVYKKNSENMMTEIQFAQNKTNETYYIATEDEFVLNAHPTKDGKPVGKRFYKNMAEHLPFTYVDGKTLQFMVPSNKDDEKSYKVVSKIASTDEALPGPIYIYDAGASGCIGAIVTNTASSGSFSDSFVINDMLHMVNEEGERCAGIEFVGGTTVILDTEAKVDAEAVTWSVTSFAYPNQTIENLKRGDVIQYTTADGKVDRIKLIVRGDDVGPIRMDGATMQRSGNMIADIISVAENGRTALVHYYSKEAGDTYQTMLVNGSVYRYESSEDEVYSSSTADLRAGDRVLINSFWWSPKAVVIFR